MTVTKSLGDTTERISRAGLRAEPIKVLTTTDPVLVDAASTLGETIAAMQAGRGEPALIREDGRLVGIVTERDILKRVLNRDADLSRPVREFMSAEPFTLSPDATIGQALDAMSAGRYRNVPLVDDGRVVGLLRQQDLLAYVAEAFPQEILNLPPRPHQKMEEPEGA